jgi:ATP-dependent helicase HrpB
MQAEMPPLPIDPVLGTLASHLAARGAAVLVAPPGAGKTTRVPLRLLDEPWAMGQRLVLLEPRRLAARAAAERMAATLGEAVGATVGLRMRLDTRVSARTRIEVVTEGVFARMILDDPGLEGIAGVLFDEFHERSLDADLSLALTLDVRGALRPDLRVLVMSATLDGARIAELLGGAPLVESAGRMFPVETVYLGRDPRERLDEAITRAILRVLEAEAGSILAFLPGQSEIRAVAERLETKIDRRAVDIAPLYGALDQTAQARAVSPTPPGRRKIVLATSIAETSLTIEGVRIVVDSGLARVARYEPDLGLTRLETRRAARAAVDQRRGRAGRTEPGVCFRLWEAAATGALDPYTAPEILSADLSGLMLDLAAWGVRDPARELTWLDPPPRPATEEARSLLQSLGGLDRDGAVTERGHAMRALALPPRLAAMVVTAATRGEADLAAEIAVVMVERGLGGDSADLMQRVEMFRRDRGPRAGAARRLAAGFAREAGASEAGASTDIDACGRLLALAFPERVAKARGKAGEFLMANGRAASVEPHHALAGAPFLAVGEVAGRAAAARILLAAPLTPAEIEAVCGDRIVDAEDITFDGARAALSGRRQRRLGALVLAEQNLAIPPSLDAAETLARGIARIGVERLPWSPQTRQWRDRVQFLRRAEGEPWPDLSFEVLAATAAEWLAPALIGKTSLAAVTPDDLAVALQSLLVWELRRRLEAEAPAHFETPAGARHLLDYGAETGPVLSVRVQELYGLRGHPSVANGRIPLTLELLSPAHRPIQVTRDLPGFWRGSWAAVRADMRGRYPKHLWPDDPAGAAPTLRAKPRG